MSAFETFVNTELPRRSALLTVAIVGYDGDPNGGGAPAALQGAPTGTWYLRETPTRTFYRKENSGATDWVDQSSGGGGGGGATEEPLAFAVDYNDVTAVDPPTGTIFAEQQDIDDFLVANATSNFKHLMGVWEALPPLIAHAVTITCAAGVHRPRATEPAATAAFPLYGKVMTGGYVLVEGDGSYDAVDPGLTGLTVTAAQLASNDPYIDFGGAPFTGFDLVGLFVQLSTGQTVVIHDHTTSRLFVTRTLSPDPTGGTATVVRPATIFRNSLDDIGVAYAGVLFDVSTDGTLTAIPTPQGGSSATHVLFSQLLMQGWTCTWHIFARTYTAMACALCLVDWDYQQTLFGVTPNNRAMQGNISTRLVMLDCGVKAPIGSGVDETIFATDKSFVAFIWSVTHGGEDAIYIAGPSSQVNFLASSVSEKSTTSVVIESSTSMFVQTAGGNRPFSIRDVTGVGLTVTNGEFLPVANGGLKIDNCTDAAVVLQDGTIANLHTWTVTGSGNAVGIRLGQGNNVLKLSGTATLTGTAGDVDVTGTVVSYADITADGPFVDGAGNWVGDV